MQLLRRPFMLGLLLSSCFGLFFLIQLNPRYMYTGDSLNNLIQAYSLLQNRFVSDELVYPGHHLDPQFAYYPHPGVYLVKLPDGRFIGQYPVALSFLSAPILFLGGPTFLPIVHAVLFALLVGYFAHRWKLSPVAILFLVFGTYIGSRSIEYSSYLYGIGFHALGFTFLLRQPGKKTAAIYGGFFLGLAVWFRLEAAIFCALLLVVWALVNLVRDGKLFGKLTRRDLPVLLICGATFTVLVVAYFLFHQLRHGHILGAYFVSNTAGLVEKTLALRLRSLLALVLGAPYKVGFFAFMPLLLLTFISLGVRAYRLRLGKIGWIITVTTLLFLPLMAFVTADDQTVVFGPRFLILGLLPSVVVFERMRRVWLRRKRPARWLMIILFIFSVALNIGWVLVLRNATRQLRVFQQAMEKVEADAHIFQNPFLASHMGTAYFEKLTFVALYPPDIEDLLSRLKKEPGKTIAFYDLAEAQTVTQKAGLDAPNWHYFDRAAYEAILSRNLILKREAKLLPEVRVRLFQIPTGGNQ